MFEFFVTFYNLLPGQGYGLVIIILLVIILILALVLVFEEMRLRKIIEDLESKLEAVQKNYQPEDENLHKEGPLQRALHKFDAEALPEKKKNDFDELPKESGSITKLEEIQKEVYGDSVSKEIGGEEDKTKNLRVEELINANEVAAASKKSDFLSVENPVDKDLPAPAVGEDGGLSTAPKSRRPYAKKQSSATAFKADSSLPDNLTPRGPYVKHSSSDQSSTELNIPVADIARKSSGSKMGSALPEVSQKGRESVSRYEVKKEFMKTRDKTRTGIEPVHIMNRKEKRRLTDDLLPRAVTGNKIETKEIDKKIKVLEHDKFIARKFKEGKYERSRIQDDIDYLKGVEKNLFNKE